MNTQLADANYRGDLGNGLVRRWSTLADQEKIGHLMGSVFRRSPTSPINIRAVDEARIFMSDAFPWAGEGDFAIVEDTSQPDKPIVASTCFWRHQWSYAGIPFGVGRPENVVTAPAYRNRGLIRALFEMFHARSAAEGHLVQAITGIPYYYRQFSYEYVLDLGGERTIPLSSLPTMPLDNATLYRLRQATLEDIPLLMCYYNQGRRDSLVWFEADEEYWRYHITGWEEPVARELGAMRVGFNGRLQMIVDQAGRVCGYTWPAAKRWGAGLDVYALQLSEQTNWQTALPSLLYALRAHGETIPAIAENDEPFSKITFGFGRTHPFYEVADEYMGEREPPYAWYLRLADVPGFIRHIAPVLEERLERSILTGYTGELLLSFYRSGLRLRFAEGKLLVSEPYQAPVDQEEEHGGCPALTFLQLLFGYRSLSELRATFPDVWVKREAVLLLNTLFPKLPSVVGSMSYS